MRSKHCSTPEHSLPDFIAQIYCLLFGCQIYMDIQSTTIIDQLELRSHSSFLFLINHRLRLYFSKDCRSSYHKPHWCLQGFLQHDHSWLQYKYTRGANASKFKFAQMTVIACSYKGNMDMVPTPLIHLSIRFLVREALKPNASLALM